MDDLAEARDVTTGVRWYIRPVDTMLNDNSYCGGMMHNKVACTMFWTTTSICKFVQSESRWHFTTAGVASVLGRVSMQPPKQMLLQVRSDPSHWHLNQTLSLGTLHTVLASSININVVYTSYVHYVPTLLPHPSPLMQKKSVVDNDDPVMAASSRRHSI